ncbi:MAG: O-antigen ligase family protein [Victivallales bacterium]|nr:O-antigen ligase family protein [Victivallales bacterium]
MFSRYQGIFRAQWIFDNPNHYGAFLVLVFGIVYFLQACCSRFNQKRRFLEIPFILAEGWLLVQIAWTYSRGAFVALFSGLLFSSLLPKSPKAWLHIALMGVLICITPAGVNRVASIADVTDGSIRNRIHLWKGICAMISESPWKGGCHLQSLGSRYRAWHMPLAIQENYQTAINDYLTIACDFGIPLAEILSFVATAMLLYGTTLCIKLKNSPPASLLNASASMFLAALLLSVFNTVYLISINRFFLGLQCLILATLIILYIHTLPPTNMMAILCISGVVTCSVFLAIFAYGKHIDNHKPYTLGHFCLSNGSPVSFLQSKDEEAVLICLLTPPYLPYDGNQPPATDASNILSDDIRIGLRAGAEIGFSSTCVITTGRKDDIAIIAEIISHMEEYVFQYKPAKPLVIFSQPNAAHLLLEAVHTLRRNVPTTLLFTDLDIVSPWRVESIEELLAPIPCNVCLITDEKQPDTNGKYRQIQSIDNLPLTSPLGFQSALKQLMHLQ